MTSWPTNDDQTPTTTGTVVGSTRSGWELILASGVRAYAPAAALAPPLRRLAPGQRVQLILDSERTIERVWL